jgi:hypothetical protein
MEFDIATPTNCYQAHSQQRDSERERAHRVLFASIRADDRLKSITCHALFNVPLAAMGGAALQTFSTSPSRSITSTASLTCSLSRAQHRLAHRTPVLEPQVQH